MSDDQVRRITVDSNYALALEYIESAEVIYKAGRVRAVIDVAYNAAELIAKNFILLTGKKLPKRHARVVEQFNLEFVTERQIVSPEIGRAFKILLVRRHEATHDSKAELTKEMAIEAIALARDLIERFRQYLAETVDKNKEDSDEQKNDS